MKKLLTLFILCGTFNFLWAQNAYRMQLLSTWNNPNLNKVDSINIWNDLTGYHDSTTGKEYVIAGSTDSIYFFDISIPTQIKLLDVEYGGVRGVINRDYEIYQHYVYCVSDQNRGTLQIFDLKYLPDSAHKVYDDSTLAINTHSIFIEAKSKRMYMCANKYPNWKNGNGLESAMDIISLENPEQPQFLAKLYVPVRGNGEVAFRWVHESHVRNDTAYLSCGYSGLFIYDLRDLNNQQIIGSIVNYPKNGYNHSSWLSNNGNYIMFTDEVPAGLDIKIFDISIIQAPRLESLFISNVGATPHNAYWVGSFAYVSHYSDGVYVWNIADTKQPRLVAYYDTYLQNKAGDYALPYSGCWGVWPYLPSGNIIASDRTNGIFVLKPDSGLLGVTDVKQTTHANIFPNPGSTEINIAIETNYKDDFEIQIFNMEGRLVETLDEHFKSNFLYTKNISHLANGLYIIQISGSNGSIRQKLLKQ